MVKGKSYLRVLAILCVIGLIGSLIPAAIISAGVKADTDGFVEVSFDSLADVKRNFDSYYFINPLKHTRQNGEEAQSVEVEQHWEIKSDDGGNYIARKNTWGNWWETPTHGQMAQLVYKTPHKNFELEIEYYQNNEGWRFPLVGFGAGLGEFVTDRNGIDAAFVDNDGWPGFWGTGIEAASDTGADDWKYFLLNKDENGVKLYEKANSEAASWHHMRLVVQGDTIAMYIDGYDPVFATDFTYAGGHIFLAVGTNEARFRNMKIKALPDTEPKEGDLLSDTEARSAFENQYGAGGNETVPGNFTEKAIDENWEWKDGTLIRKPDTDSGSVGNVAMLTYTGRKYLDFTLEVDYYQSPKNWKYAMVGFGAQSAGDFYNKSETSTLAYTQQEGLATFRNPKIVDGDWHAVAKQLAPIYENKGYGYQNNARWPRWRHMKLEVLDGRARMWIDYADEYLEVTLPESYEGGYIYLAAACNEARFKNLTVTPLEGEFGGFGSMDELKSKFDSHFAEEADHQKRTDDLTGFVPLDAAEKWRVTSGGILIRRPEPDSGADSMESRKMAMLTFKEKKYKNFELNVDYFQDPKTWKWAIVGFGAPEAGRFATDSPQSIAAYVWQEGNRVFWGTGLPGGDGNNRLVDQPLPDYDNRNNPQWHHMRLVVLNGSAKMYIDDVETPHIVQLPEGYEGGYVYLAAGCNEARFKNFRVVDYDEGDIVIASIGEKEKFEDRVINRADNDTLGLPDEMKVQDMAGNEYLLPVEWESDDYCSGKAGTFQFTSKLNLPNAFKNPQNLSVSFEVTNVIDHDPETTVKYYFDHKNDVKDFKSYYALHAADKGIMVESPFEKHWALIGSSLHRIGRTLDVPNPYSDYGAFGDVASMVYTGQKFRNYEVSVNFCRGQDTWAWTMVTIGADSPGKFPLIKGTGVDSNDPNVPAVVKNPGGGIGIYLEREGYLNVFGNIHDQASWDGNIRYKLNDTGENGISVDYDDNKVHNLRIRVVNQKMEIFLDGQKAPIWFKVLDNSAEGYVGLTTNMNSGAYSEFSITQLDYFGNPVKLRSEWETPDDVEWKPGDDAFGANLTEKDIEGNAPSEKPEDSESGTGNEPGNVKTGVPLPVPAAAALLGSAPVLAMAYKKRKRKRSGTKQRNGIGRRWL